MRKSSRSYDLRDAENTTEMAFLSQECGPSVLALENKV